MAVPMLKQGPILGPLLINNFKIDLPLCKDNCEIEIFAVLLQFVKIFSGRTRCNYLPEAGSVAPP